MFQQHISRSHPGCIIFLVDLSLSMTEHLAGSFRAKSVAELINRFLGELIVACQKAEGKPRHFFDIGVIGYTTDIHGMPSVGPCFQGALAGRNLVSVVDLYNNPVELSNFDEDAKAGAGTEIGPVFWYRTPPPEAMGGAPQRAALQRCLQIASEWCTGHPESFPPIVVHITHGESTDGNPDREAAALRSSITQDGNLLLFHCYLSSHNTKSILYSNNEQEMPDGYARTLFHLSSPLPEELRRVAEEKGIFISAGSRGVIVNSSSFSFLLALINVDTAVGDPVLDENVQFTVYRPRTIQPAKWYPLLAFAHLSESRSDAPEVESDPIAEVARQARNILGRHASAYQDVTQDSRQAVPRAGELTFVPVMEGIEFNPPRRSFLWLESVHREEFRLWASPDLDRRTGRGRLAVFLGNILLSEVSLSIRVDSTHAPSSVSEPPESSTASRYRRIFASYSHKDLPVVEEFERYARALGDEYLRDWIHLRAGEVWDERLMQMIEAADIFQLFWSRNAMASEYVEKEWRYALSLNRPLFVRPTYWEEPLPEMPHKDLPPPELRRLHFQRLHSGSRGHPAPASEMRLDPSPAAKKVDSDSGFELTLDDSEGIAGERGANSAEESGSAAVALDEGDTDLESSEYDLSLEGEESGSQVCPLEIEEEGDEGAATIQRKPPDARGEGALREELDEDLSEAPAAEAEEEACLAASFDPGPAERTSWLQKNETLVLWLTAIGGLVFLIVFFAWLRSH